MKFLLAIFALIFSSGAIHAQTAADSENTKSIPVRHWEFDYFNYGVSAGQGTAYLSSFAKSIFIPPQTTDSLHSNR